MKKRFFIVTLLVLLVCYCASAGVFAESRRSVNSKEMSVEYSSEISPEVAKLLEDLEEEDIEEDSEEEDSEDVDTEDEDTEEDIESEDTDEEEETEESEEDFETVYDWGENLEEPEVVYQWEDIDETTEDVDSEEDDSEDIDDSEEDADDDSEEEIADADSEEDVDEDIDSEENVDDEDVDIDEEDSGLSAGGVVSIHYPHVVTNGKMVTITEVSFASEDQAFAWIANHLDVEIENIVFYSENGKIVEIVINSYDFEEEEEDVVDEPATTSYAEDDIFTDIAADEEVAEDVEETTEDVEDIEEVESEASEDEDTSSNTSEDDGNSKKNMNKGFFVGDCKPEYPETYSFSAEEDPSED